MIYIFALTKSPVCLLFPLIFFSEPLLVLIEYVPFGDLLRYLRKSRGLNDTYYKDPDVKPKTSLTSQRLMKFAWPIEDGMSDLSSKRVCKVLFYWTFMICALIGLFPICTLLLDGSHSNGFHYMYVISIMWPVIKVPIRVSPVFLPILSGYVFFRGWPFNGGRTELAQVVFI